MIRRYHFLAPHTYSTLIETAAYASFQENITGSFKVGKKFDAVIWDRDIMRVEPATEVLHAKVSATIVDGRPVYGSL